MLSTNCVRAGLAAVALMFSGQHIKAQSNLDPSKCYSDVLRKTDIIENNDHLRLVLLSSINSSTFEQLKLDGNLTAMYKAIPFQAGFDAFKEARKEYFEQQGLNVDHESETVGVSVGLDPQASAIFQACVAALAKGAYGLSTLGSSEDERISSLELFWSPTTPGQTIKIVDSSLVNALVVGGEKHPGKLFAGPLSVSDYKVILLKRLDPNKAIAITLETVPSVRVGTVRIGSVPPLYNCRTEDLDFDLQTGVKFSLSEQFMADDHLERNLPDGPNGTRWAYSKKVDGRVTSISCSLPDPGWIALDDPNGHGSGVNTDTATCSGSKNGAARAVHMDVTWSKVFHQCNAIPWEQEEREKKIAAATTN